MGIFDSLINQPLGYIIKVIYDWVGDYGTAIILFSIVTRIILLPLGYKQQKSMAASRQLQPLLAEIKRKYKNDKDRVSQETLKLYQQHKINPLGGCLPLLIQMPILFGLIRVIYDPVTFVLKQNTTELLARFPDIAATGITAKIELAKRLPEIGLAGINFNFLGIDMSAIPNYKVPSVLWIIPILAAAATYLSGKQSQKQNPAGSGDQASQMSGSMTTIFPIMTLFFTFTMPVSAAMYWLMSSILQVGQQFAFDWYFKRHPVDIRALEGGKK